MSRTLPLHTCSICKKLTFCWRCKTGYKCNKCYDGTDTPVRVEGNCKTRQKAKKSYLKWAKTYRNSKIKI